MRTGIVLTVGAALVGIGASLSLGPLESPRHALPSAPPVVRVEPQEPSPLPDPAQVEGPRGPAEAIVPAAPVATERDVPAPGTDRLGEVEAAFQRALALPEVAASSIEVLRLHAHDADIETRSRALEALAALGDDWGRKVWETALVDDPDARVRARLARQVPEELAGDPRARDARLRLAMGDVSADVRRAAMEGWSGALADDEADRLLSALARELDAPTRRATIETLSTCAPSHVGVASACWAAAASANEPRDIRSAGLAGLRIASATRPGAFDPARLAALDRAIQGR